MGAVTLLPALRRLAVAGTVAGAGLTAYAMAEARAYTLRRVTVPVLPPGSPDVRVLHLSDVHLTPGQRRKQDWVSRLAATDPDLVVTTGDNLAHPDAVTAVVSALQPLLERPGAFVFGSSLKPRGASLAAKRTARMMRTGSSR